MWDLKPKQSGLRRLCDGFALLAALAAVSACGGSSSNSSGASKAGGTSTAAKKIVVPHIAYLNTAISTFNNSQLAGMKAQAATVGGTVRQFAANSDPSLQQRQCQDAITSGEFNAFIIYAVDGVAIRPCVMQAAAAHIEVIPISQPIGPNNATGKIQLPQIHASEVFPLSLDVAATVQLVKMACAAAGPPPCNVVVVESVPSFTYSAYKLQHEVPSFQKLGFHVIATPVTGNFDDVSGTKSAIKTVLATGKHISVIVSDDDSSIQGAVQLKAAGLLPKSTMIIGDGGAVPQ
jgi:ribose transport system substrate-binding protein